MRALWEDHLGSQHLVNFPDEGFQVYYPTARTSKDFRQVDGKDANHVGLGNARTEKGRQNEIENMRLPGLQHEIILNRSLCMIYRRVQRRWPLQSGCATRDDRAISLLTEDHQSPHMT